MTTIHSFDTAKETYEFLDKQDPSTLVVILFYTHWAKQSEPVRQLLTALAGTIAPEEPPRAAFLWVQAEYLPEVSKKFGVRSVPWTVLQRDGTEVCVIHGARPEEVRDTVERELKKRDEDVKKGANRAELPGKLEVNPRKLPPGAGAPTAKLPGAGAAAAAAPASSDAAPAKDFSAYAPGPSDPATAPSMTTDATEGKDTEAALNERLAGLVKAAPVMLFMKGTPSTPECGFSRQLVAILRKNGVKYGFFNILADEDVRQGLKKWADWPTYPQLWVKGELVGGIDIVKEEVEKNPDFFKEFSVKAQNDTSGSEAQKEPAAVSVSST